jgi:hypothetical protein
MQEFGRLNYSSDNLQRLNKVRMHQQVLFLSDVMDASGQGIDKKYLQPRPMDKAWSDLVFPIEFPAPRDFRIWKEAIPHIQAFGGRLHLGRYTRQGQKFWEWRYNLEKTNSTTSRASLWTSTNHPSLRVHIQQIDTQGPVMTRPGVHKADHAQWERQG